MNYLSFDRVIFNSLLCSLYRNIFSVNILEHLRNILSLVFNSVIVSDDPFPRDLNHLTYFLIFNVWFFIRNISLVRFEFLLNSAFTPDWCSWSYHLSLWGINGRWSQRSHWLGDICRLGHISRRWVGQRGIVWNSLRTSLNHCTG